MADAEVTAEETAAEPVAAQAPLGKDWSKALIVANGPIKAGEKRPVVVCETRGPDGELLARDYPKGADLYYRTHAGADPGIRGPKHKGEDPVVFPAGEVVTLGETVEQGPLWGLSTTPGVVHVGPASPVYGAINLAHLKFLENGKEGTQEIEVQGLTQAQQTQLRPWIDGIATYRPPAVPEEWTPPDVKVTFS